MAEGGETPWAMCWLWKLLPESDTHHFCPHFIGQSKLMWKERHHERKAERGGQRHWPGASETINQPTFPKMMPFIPPVIACVPDILSLHWLSPDTHSLFSHSKNNAQFLVGLQVKLFIPQVAMELGVAVYQTPGSVEGEPPWYAIQIIPLKGRDRRPLCYPLPHPGVWNLELCWTISGQEWYPRDDKSARYKEFVPPRDLCHWATKPAWPSTWEINRFRFIFRHCYFGFVFQQSYPFPTQYIPFL